MLLSLTTLFVMVVWWYVRANAPLPSVSRPQAAHTPHPVPPQAAAELPIAHCSQLRTCVYRVKVARGVIAQHRVQRRVTVRRKRCTVTRHQFTIHAPFRAARLADERREGVALATGG